MNEYDVFISYSYKDKAVTDSICHYFENDKLKCWMAPRDILPGMKWAKSIADAIPKCRIFLLVFSSHSNSSDQVLREVELAVSYGKIIVPVRIEDIKPAEGMEYYLATVHWINILDRKIEGKLIELTETVRNIIHANMKPEQDINLIAKKQKRKAFAFIKWIIIGLLIAAGVIIFVLMNSNIINLDQIFASTTPEPFKAAAAATTPASIVATPMLDATPTTGPTATIDPAIAPDTLIDIPDFYLRSAIMQSLELVGHPVDGSIQVSDMLKLKRFVVNSYERFEAEGHDNQEKEFTVLTHNNIESLEGLQYAQNLTDLSIEESSIQNISVLTQIHTLVGISISNSEIVDISPIVGNTELEFVYLGGNQIHDIEPLAALYKIKDLGINGNHLDSVSVLLDLPNLRQLDATNIVCDDVDLILELKNLMVLRISSTAIDDLSPLLSFENLETLYIDGVQYEKNRRVVEELMAKGCNVFW